MIERQLVQTVEKVKIYWQRYSYSRLLKRSRYIDRETVSPDC